MSLYFWKLVLGQVDGRPVVLFGSSGNRRAPPSGLPGLIEADADVHPAKALNKQALDSGSVD